MPALPPGAGTTGAEDAPIKNDDSADGRARGAGEGGDGNNDETETMVSLLAAFKRLEQESREERVLLEKRFADQQLRAGTTEMRDVPLFVHWRQKLSELSIHRLRYSIVTPVLCMRHVKTLGLVVSARS